MKTRLYVVKDIKVGSIGAVLKFRNDAMAVRSFGDAVQQKDSIYNVHPSDFALLCVGEIDEESGIISAYAVPDCIVNATDFATEG